MIEAHCTWGEGPDVLIRFYDHGYVNYDLQLDYKNWANGLSMNGSADLTLEEADLLLKSLKNAIYECRKLERELEENLSASSSAG